MKNKLLLLLIVFSMLLGGCSSASEITKKSQSASYSPDSEKAKPKVQNELPKEANQSTENVKQSTKNTNNLIPAQIVQNVDGDTVVIRLGGREEKVRMLCVDTPETHHPRLGVQPFGPEAADFTKKILYVGRNVQIEEGIGGGRDKYGRLLAYIYVDGKMFNEMLLEKGLARVAYIYAPNTKYVDEFYAIQKKAQKEGIGIWSIENYARDDGYHADKAQGSNPSGMTSNQSKGTKFENNPSDDQETNLKCKGKIKGNANSHVYHVPGGAYYESTKDNIIWFCTEQDAQKAGYRKSKK